MLRSSFALDDELAVVGLLPLWSEEAEGSLLSMAVLALRTSGICSSRSALSYLNSVIALITERLSTLSPVARC